MQTLTLYPKSTYISNCRENEIFYNNNTLLVGKNNYGNVHYASLFKFSNSIDINDIEILNASLNITLLNDNKFSIEEFRNNIAIYKIIEDFNIENVSWNNYPKAIALKLLDSDINYKDNIVSFNISSLYENVLELQNSVYGLIIICRPSLKSSIYQIYSSSSDKQPLIAINYEKSTNNEIKNLEIIFKENEFTIQSSDSEFFSETINISNFNNATYFIKNLGDLPVYAYLQISPDGINFADEVVEAYINAGESKILPITNFLKFSRVKFINRQNDTGSNIQIWFQGQTFDYYMK